MRCVRACLLLTLLLGTATHAQEVELDPVPVQEEDRSAELERQLADARSALTAAERRITELERALASARNAAASADAAAGARIAELEQALAGTEAALTEAEAVPVVDPELVAALHEAEARIAELAVNLAEARTAADAAAETDFRELWPWLAAMVAFLLLAGFGAGWLLLDRRVRDRHGGFRTW